MMKEPIQEFTAIGISEVLAETVIRYLRNWKNQMDFPVSPTDDIYRVYGIVDEDLDDFVLAIANANELIPPENTAYWPTPVVTVLDLINFVMTFPRKHKVV